MSQRFKFTSEKDLLLLREALRVNVYSHIHKSSEVWKTVAANLSGLENGLFGSASARTLRDRTKLLLNQYSAHLEDNEASSGNKPESGEHQQLLEELLQRRENFLAIASDTERLQKEKEMWELIRQQAIEDVTSRAECSISTSTGTYSCSVSGSSPASLTAEDATAATPNPAVEREKERVIAESDLLDYLREVEANRARERQEELRLRREELEEHKKEREAFISLLERLIPKADSK